MLAFQLLLECWRTLLSLMMLAFFVVAVVSAVTSVSDVAEVLESLAPFSDVALVIDVDGCRRWNFCCCWSLLTAALLLAIKVFK